MHNTENEETNAEAVKRMETEGKTRIKQTKQNKEKIMIVLNKELQTEKAGITG